MRPFLVATVGILIFSLLLLNLFPIVRAQPAIRGQIVLDVGSTWDGNRVYRPVVIYNGSLFMMWYTGGTGGSHDIGLAISTDGIAWTRYAINPDFAPTAVFTRGASGQWDSSSVEEAWVMKDAGQYKMWYSGQIWDSSGEILSYSIGYATSPDGIHWTRYSGNPVLMTGVSGSWDDKWVWRPTVVFDGTSYIMYFRGASKQGTQAKAGVATSPDGIHWTKTLVLTVPVGGAGWDAYSRQTEALNVGSLMKLGDLYVMGYSSIKTSTSAPEIGFASSPDGTNWTPYQGNPVITYGISSWDSGGVDRPMAVVVGDKYYVYYDAQRTLTDLVPTRIGLAILPMSQYPIPEYSSSLLAVAVALLSLAGFLARRRRIRQFRPCFT